MIVDLEELTTLRPSVPIDIADALAGAAAAIDEAQGAGAKDIVQRVTLNIGVFINAVLNFTIVAFAVFMAVRAINSARRQAPPAPPAPTPSEALLTEIRDLLKSR